MGFPQRQVIIHITAINAVTIQAAVAKNSQTLACISQFRACKRQRTSCADWAWFGNIFCVMGEGKPNIRKRLPQLHGSPRINCCREEFPYHSEVLHKQTGSEHLHYTNGLKRLTTSIDTSSNNNPRILLGRGAAWPGRLAWRWMW